MDQETRKFLEGNFEVIGKKFDAIDKKFDAIDKKFGVIDQKFEENKRYVDQKFEENKRYVNQKFEENKRYFGVVSEGLRNEIQQVAEGHQILLDGQARITDRMDRMERELGSMIKFSYAELDQRIRVIENEFQTLKIRLDRLEEAQRN